MQKRSFFILVLLLISAFSCQAQAWKWAKSLGQSNNITTIKNIRPYTGTNLLVSGSFASPTLALGSQTLTNSGQDDGYMAIVDDWGQYAWAAKFGGANQDFVVDAAAAPNGDFVVAGNFKSITMTIGSTNLFNSGETDAFVAKYNADKTLAWAKKIGSTDIDEASGLAIDAEGNIYVSGHVLDKFTQSALYVFVRKLNAAGNLVWEKKGNTQGNYLQATTLALDDQAVYLGGTLYGTATFGNTELLSDTSYAAFIVKYSHAGVLTDTYLNTTLDKFNGMQAKEGNLYACAEKLRGCFGWGWPLRDSKTHLLKFDSNLNPVWHKTAGGEGYCQSLDVAKSLSVDDDGNIYLTGYFFSDTLRFAGQELPNPLNLEYYYPQIFVFKYSPNGNELWAKSLGGIHADEATSIHAFGNDKFYLGGNFESDPAAFGAYNLHNTSTLDSIYVHLRPARYGRKTMGFLAVFEGDASGTHPEPAFQDVAIFPNPVTGQITVRLKSTTHSPVTLQLMAADGNLLRQTAYHDPIAVLQEDLTGLPPGLYFVALRTEKGVFVGKVVKN